MIPELHKILYGEVDHTPKQRGRFVAPLTSREVQLQIGSLADRIFVYLSALDSAKVSEIARACGSSAQKTHKTLRDMATEGILEEIAVVGCPVEYALIER